MSSQAAQPRLRVISSPIEEAPDLVSLADPTHPLLWVRGDRGCVGIGEAFRITRSGPNRFAELSAAWQELSALAQVDDRVSLPGSGLLALGTVAFADESAATSVLIVPRVLVARHRERAWVTTVEVVAHDGEPSGQVPDVLTTPPALPTPLPLGSAPHATFSPGAFSEAAHQAAVAELTRRISCDEVEKVVLARDLVGRVADSADLRVPLGRLATGYLDCWTFAVDGLVGASPETLVRSTDGAVSARVLAGTAPRFADPVADATARDALITSDKNQQEHAYAVDSVTEALAPHVRDLSRSEQPFALELPNVWHLATDLGGGLASTATSLTLAGALHPTAAIAGTPTPVAIAQIRELEPFDRGRYSGAVGWIDHRGDGEWAIALRCAQLGEPEAGTRAITAHAGGGIVAGSDPLAEFEETHSKFAPILDAFGG